MGSVLPDGGPPPDLVDWLARLVERQGGPPLRPGLPPGVVPPSWRRWLEDAEALRRWVELADRAATLAGDAAREAQAAYARARMAALDKLVGEPCLAAAGAFLLAGHADAGALLREFVLAIGPESRRFPAGSAFSLGFARSETTRGIIGRGLAQWKARAGGLGANGGRFTNAAGTFVPLSLGVSLLPMPAPRLRIVGSPEAHVIGSFSYQGRLAAGDLVEWQAVNVMSLQSFCGENWTRSIDISLVSNNHRPERYGNITQVIEWRTRLDGEVVA